MNNIENLRNDLMRYLHCLPSGNFNNVMQIFKKYIKKENEQKEYIYNQIKELYDNENITGFSKLAYAKCLDIIKNK